MKLDEAIEMARRYVETERPPTREAIATILAALPVTHVGMDDAPMGRDILAYSQRDLWQLITWNGQGYGIYTHWQQLPEAPQ